MKPLATKALVSLLLTLGIIALGCGESPTATPVPTSAPPPLPTPPATPIPYQPVTVTGSNGVEVVFSERPRRIVSYSPAFTEVLFAVDLGDTLVGRDKYSDFPPQAAGVPSIGDAFNVNLEALAELEPDLVYISFETPVSAIQNLGIKVLYLNPPDSLNGVLDQIRLFGRILDATAGAEALAASMQARIETVRRQLSGVEQGPRVFFELDPLLYTVGPDSFIGSLLTTLKAQNIAEDAGGPFPQISVETVVERDPQVILFTDTATESPETIASRAGWDTITAVQENRVFPVQSDLVSRPGPRIVEGLESLAMLLYPDLLARSSAPPQPTPTTTLQEVG